MCTFTVYCLLVIIPLKLRMPVEVFIDITLFIFYTLFLLTLKLTHGFFDILFLRNVSSDDFTADMFSEAKYFTEPHLFICLEGLLNG